MDKKKSQTKGKIKINTKNESENNESTFFKRFIIFIFILFSIFLAIYISDSNFRNFVDTKILRKVVNEENIKEIYEEVNAQNIFLSSKNIHILNSGELKTYDKFGNLISSNILSIGSAVSDFSGDYMVLAEKEGRKIFLFEKGKLKWEREVEVNINNVFVNRNGKICVIGKTSIYNSSLILMDQNGNSYLKRYFKTRYVSKAGVSGNDKYLVLALIDYAKIKISSEIEIMDIQKAINDEEGSIIKKYEREELILDIDVLDTEETIVKYLNDIYLVNKEEEKKVHDIPNEAIFVSVKVNGGFAEIIETKTNLFKLNYELKIYDKYGGQTGVLLLEDDTPKDMKSFGANILVQMPQKVIVSSEIGWLKKRFDAKRNFIDAKISEELMAVIYSDRIAVISL